MASARVEHRFNLCFRVDAYGRMQARRVMEPYRQARDHLLTVATSASSPATRVRQRAEGTETLRELPCWSFFRNRLSAAPRDETLADLLRLGGLQLHLGDGAGGDAQYAVHASLAWSPSELEYRHDYIQWLFPLRESGVNFYAALLTDRDVLQLRQDGVAMANVLCAFYVMLRFYGMQMIISPVNVGEREEETSSSTARSKTKKRRTTSATATTEAADDGAPAARYTATFSRVARIDEQRAQYINLSTHGHNYLRISRILQFLGEVGLEPLKVGWLRFLAREILVPSLTPPLEHEVHDDDSHSRGSSSSSSSSSSVGYPVPPLANCEDSFVTFWIETPYAADTRLELKKDALAVLDAVNAALGSREEGITPAVSGTIGWALDSQGGGPVVRTAPFWLPSQSPVEALPFYVDASPAAPKPRAKKSGASATQRAKRPRTPSP